VTVVPCLSLLRFSVELPGTVMSLRTMLVQLAVADATALYAVTVHVVAVVADGAGGDVAGDARDSELKASQRRPQGKSEGCLVLARRR
jgi:hypothetical protein